MILDKIREIINEQTGIEFEEITLEASLVDDLGLDSLDLYEMALTLEEEYDLPETNEEELAKFATVGDVVNFISKHVD